MPAARSSTAKFTCMEFIGFIALQAKTAHRVASKRETWADWRNAPQGYRNAPGAPQDREAGAGHADAPEQSDRPGTRPRNPNRSARRSGMRHTGSDRQAYESPRPGLPACHSMLRSNPRRRVPPLQFPGNRLPGGSSSARPGARPGRLRRPQTTPAISNTERPACLFPASLCSASFCPHPCLDAGTLTSCSDTFVTKSGTPQS